MPIVTSKVITSGKSKNGMLIGAIVGKFDDITKIEILDSEGNPTISYELNDGLTDANRIRVTTKETVISQKHMNDIADKHINIHNCCGNAFNAAIIKTIAELSSSWGNAKTPQEIMNMCKANLP